MVTWHKAISLHCQLILACRHVRYAARLPLHPPRQPPSLHPRLSAAEQRSEHTEKEGKSSATFSHTPTSAGRDSAQLNLGFVIQACTMNKKKNNEIKWPLFIKHVRRMLCMLRRLSSNDNNR